MSPPTHQFKDIHRIKVRFRNSALRFVRTDTLLKALAVPDVDFFPNITEVLKIGCTFAVTSAECERLIGLGT